MKYKLTPVTHFHLKPGDEVRAYHNMERKWCRPVRIVRKLDKEIYVTDVMKTRIHGIAQVISSLAKNQNKDLQRILTSLQKYVQGYVPDVFIIETIQRFGNGTDTEPFRHSMKNKTEALQNRGWFEETSTDQLPFYCSILSSQIVFTLKNVGTEQELPKAIPVAQGHMEYEKPITVHERTILKQSSLQIILCFASVAS